MVFDSALNALQLELLQLWLLILVRLHEDMTYNTSFYNFLFSNFTDKMAFHVFRVLMAWSFITITKGKKY